MDGPAVNEAILWSKFLGLISVQANMSSLCPVKVPLSRAAPLTALTKADWSCSYTNICPRGGNDLIGSVKSQWMEPKKIYFLLKYVIPKLGENGMA